MGCCQDDPDYEVTWAEMIAAGVLLVAFGLLIWLVVKAVV